MDKRQERLIEISDEILTFLLNYKQSHPGFKFWLRSKESTRSDDKSRLGSGQWFQGSNYIFLSFYDASGHVNMTRSIGWVVWFDESLTPNFYIEIVWPTEQDQQKVKAYLDIINSIGGFKKENETKYHKELPKEDVEISLLNFIENYLPQINEILERNNLLDKFTIPDDKFNRQLNRVLEIRSTLYGNKTPAESKNINQSPMPLNVILYGPPGTGKTFSTINHALTIIDGEKQVLELEKRRGRKGLTERFEELNKQGYIEFITFHQNYSYEEFIQGIKPKIEGATQLIFEKKDGVFKTLADEALKNLLVSTAKEVVTEPTFEEVFDDFFKPLIDETGTIKIQMESEGYQFELIKYNPELYNVDFRKQSGGIGHSIYLPTLKKYFEQPGIEHTQGLKSYYKPLARTMIKRAEQLKKVVPGVERRKYVLIIDEINRANISRVFGELITLLEEDKRWDNEHKMKVKLPSGDEFTVPKNLYIIGTMNTADKSIALLDIALRRRFEFIPMYPEVQYVKEEFKLFFTNLNENIRKERGSDFAIGHSYLMEHTDKPLDFASTMYKKIIPLLTEYFYSAKEGKVQELIETALKAGGLFEKYSLKSNASGILSIQQN